MKSYIVESTNYIGEVRYKFSDSGSLLGVDVPEELSVEMRTAVFKFAPIKFEQLEAMIEVAKKRGTLKAFYEEKQDVSFETFWQLYKRKDNKTKAEWKFNRMPLNDRIKAISYLEIFNKKKQKSNEYYPLAVTYLNERRFDDLFN